MDEENQSAPLAMFSSLFDNRVSPEGQRVAKSIYDTVEKRRGEYETQEDKNAEEVRRSVAEARAELVAARQRLAEKKYNNADTLLSMSAAFGSPTKTGGFGEVLGNVSGALIEPTRRRRQELRDDEKEKLNYSNMISGIDTDLAKYSGEILSRRRANDVRLQTEALKILGKPVNSGSGKSMSEFGKVAMDEGYEPNTPEFHTRVQELSALDRRNKAATAGTDADPEAEAAQREQMAYQMGVPVPAIDPFQGQSTEVQKDTRNKLLSAGQKKMEELSSRASEAAKSDAQLDRFLQNSDNTWFNGAFWTLPGIGWLTGALDPDAQEMDSAAAEMAMNKRVEGSGTVSNFDAQQLIRAAMGRGKSRITNNNIGSGIKAFNKATRDQAQFYQDYFALNKHLVGADQLWREYMDANPLFDKTRPGQLVRNKTYASGSEYDPRMLGKGVRLNYRTYFRMKMGGIPAVEKGGKPRLPADDAEEPEMADGGSVRKAVEGLRDFDEELSKREKDAKHIDMEFAEGGAVFEEDEDSQPAEDAPLAHRDPEFMDNVRALGQGATFNLSDEILGALGADVTQERAGLQSKAERAPVSNFALEAAGGAGTGYIATKLVDALAKKSGKLGMAAKALQKAIPKSKTGRVVAAGGTAGALSGAGAAEEGERGSGALLGGFTGAVAGPLFGLAGKYGMRGYNAIRDRLAGDMLHPAERAVLEAADDDGLTADLMARRLRNDRRLGVPSALGDTGGGHVEALSESAALRRGPASRRMVSETARRQTGANDRAQDAVNKALKPDVYVTKEGDLTDALYTNAKPLYESAYQNAKPVPYTTVKKFLTDPVGKSAWKEAVAMMNREGIPIGKTRVGGQVTHLSLQSLDYLSRGLGDAVKREEVHGPTDYGRSLRKMRGELMGILDKASPDYSKARAQYKGDIEVLDALRSGREEFSKARTDELARDFPSLSFAEKDAYRTGAAWHIFDELDKVAGDANPFQKIMGNNAIRKRLEVLFDKPGEYKRFMEGMEREYGMYNASKKRLQAAAGARKGRARAELDGSPVTDAASTGLDTAAQATLLGPGLGTDYSRPWAIARALEWARGKLPHAQENAEKTAEILSIDTPDAADDFARRMGTKETKLRKRRAAGENAARQISRGAAVASQPSPSGALQEVESGLLDGEFEDAQ